MLRACEPAGCQRAMLRGGRLQYTNRAVGSGKFPPAFSVARHARTPPAIWAARLAGSVICMRVVQEYLVLWYWWRLGNGGCLFAAIGIYTYSIAGGTRAGSCFACPLLAVGIQVTAYVSAGRTGVALQHVWRSAVTMACRRAYSAANHGTHCIGVHRVFSAIVVGGETLGAGMWGKGECMRYAARPVCLSLALTTPTRTVGWYRGGLGMLAAHPCPPTFAHISPEATDCSRGVRPRGAMRRKRARERDR